MVRYEFVHKTGVVSTGREVQAAVVLTSSWSQVCMQGAVIDGASLFYNFTSWLIEKYLLRYHYLSNYYLGELL